MPSSCSLNRLSFSYTASRPFLSAMSAAVRRMPLDLTDQDVDALREELEDSQRALVQAGLFGKKLLEESDALKCELRALKEDNAWMKKVSSNILYNKPVKKHTINYSTVFRPSKTRFSQGFGGLQVQCRKQGCKFGRRTRK